MGVLGYFKPLRKGEFKTLWLGAYFKPAGLGENSKIVYGARLPTLET